MFQITHFIEEVELFRTGRARTVRTLRPDSSCDSPREATARCGARLSVRYRTDWRRGSRSENFLRKADGQMRAQAKQIRRAAQVDFRQGQLR